MGTEIEFAVLPYVRLDEAYTVADHQAVIGQRQQYICRILNKPDFLPEGVVEYGGFLSNGARKYIDVGHHNEYSTPVVWGALKSVIARAAAVETMTQVAANAKAKLREYYPQKADFSLVWGVTDRKRECWGEHLNLLAPRWLEVEDLPEQGPEPPTTMLAPVILQLMGSMVVAGSGCIDHDSGRFRISQKAPFIYELMNQHTTTNRPVINTRDQPHARVDWYRRLHTVFIEPVHSPFAAFWRNATVELALAFTEAQPAEAEAMSAYFPRNTNAAMRQVSYDTSLTAKFPTWGAGECSLLDISKYTREKVQKAVDQGTIKTDGKYAERRVALEAWDWGLDHARDFELLAPYSDWRFRSAYLDKKSSSCSEEDLKLYDLQCDNPESQYSKKLQRLGWERLAKLFGVTATSLTDQVADQIVNPPEVSAQLRGDAVRRNYELWVEDEYHSGQVDWSRWKVDAGPMMLEHPLDTKVRIPGGRDGIMGT